ncbi:adenosine deaminase [Paenibacillus sp. GCM10012307]|uniref:adenosine deaminase n=1 Tax=Paenibacillus roseus TaxID=2798579 RepID=A0A934MN19_9BACL|nr:adenosine deaminase [Paenibacillus roseus]MBJ6363985.1 adenosine deaminase [Paenibacillus roseus]
MIRKLQKMPKTELHMHLDGSVQPSTLLQLAARSGQPLEFQEPNELLPCMQVEEDCRNLKEYLEKFDFVLPYLQSAEALEQVAYEAVFQCAEQGCLYTEVRFAPQLHILKGLSVSDVIAHVLSGLHKANTELGILAQGIAICMRHHNETQNLETVEAAAAFLGRGLAAVDLAGDEASFPASNFRSVFARARELGLPTTIHAGEAAGADNIREAVYGLHALRIGHGIRLQESSELALAILELGVPLEMCPTSNIQTKAVPDWESYPIRDYFSQGIKVTINTDNPTVSNTTLTREYEQLHQRFGFTWEELKQISLNGAAAAFLPDDEKQLLKEKMLERFRELEAEEE